MDRAFIVGMGSTGASCLRYLQGKMQLFLTDTRMAENPAIEAELNKHAADIAGVECIKPLLLGNLLTETDTVYVSPGVPLHDPICRDIRHSGAKLSCDIELFLENVNEPVIGITGTNGKSTTTDLVARMLEPHCFKTGGNIGTPALDLLSDPANGYVLELSSFQLEKMHPPSLECATVLNITPDHLDHHRSFDAYAASKHRIYEHCDTAVFDNADPICVPSACNESIAINGRRDWCVNERSVMIAGEELSTDGMLLSGAKNYLNIVTASALAHTCGASFTDIVETVRTYEGLPHRTQLVAEVDDVSYINDSKATNVAATEAALANFGSNAKNLVLLAGGEGKDAMFSTLQDSLKRTTKMVVLFGRDADAIANAIHGSVPVTFADTLNHAVDRARQIAQAGDVVLLSPACASFDMFQDYQDRGRQFEQLVRALNG